MRKARLKYYIILITYGIALYLILTNLPSVISALDFFRSIVRPFLTGFIIAYLLNIPFSWLMRKPFAKLADKGGKWLSLTKTLAILLSYVIVSFVLGGLIWYIVPQLIASISRLIQNLPHYINTVEGFLSQLEETIGSDYYQHAQIAASWENIIETGTRISADVMPNLIESLMGLTSGVFNWIISIIFSIYLLYDKNNLQRRFKHLVEAFGPQKHMDRIMELTQRTNLMFKGFIGGTLIDSLIVFFMCFIGLSLLQVPYALLVSVIIGITNIIPIVGPFIGAIPGGFIIFLVDPLKALIFFIYVLIVQQLDGNIIKPRVFGNKVGLPSLWVLLAIVVFGGIFGVVGMVIGVPILALAYSVLAEEVQKRNAKRKASSNEPLDPHQMAEDKD